MADSTPDILTEGATPPSKHPLRRVVITLLKLAIAVLGIWYVVHTITWDDTAIVKKGVEIRTVKLVEDTPVRMMGEFSPNAGAPGPHKTTYEVEFPASFEGEVDTPGGGKQRIVIEDKNREMWNFPRVMDLPADRFKVVEKDIIHHGLKNTLIAASSRWYLLLAAWVILVVPFLVSSVRWRALMRPQGIEMPLGKAIQLTFVGQFYSIMLPGVTGGDLVKIIYAARLTGSKTKSIVTILLDRAVGLIALMCIAGVAAGMQLLWNRQAAGAPGGGGAPNGIVGDATLRNVLLLIVGILGGIALFALVYFSRRLRTMTGLQRIIDHPRMPDFVKHADEVLHRYRGHFGLLVWAFLISVVSQLMLPLSAWLSGIAFGIDMHPGYYLAYVPIAVIASSLPISPPQGLGFMDAILMHFFVNRGTAKVGQVFALTQAIRFLPILWNLVGAYWVVTGKFRREPAGAVPEGIEVPPEGT
jgi:uncharacterized membrane protein YbhN (UPF0104 family)